MPADIPHLFLVTAPWVAGLPPRLPRWPGRLIPGYWPNRGRVAV